MLWRDRTTLCNFLVEIFILSRHVSSLAEAMSWHLHNGLINIGQRGAAPLFSVRLGSASNELPMLGPPSGLAAGVTSRNDRTGYK